MKCCIISGDFIDAVAALSQSNQMDAEGQSWGALCNLLSELADDDTDDSAHQRHLKRTGFKTDAELCARMSNAIIERAKKMTDLAGRLTLTAMLLANSEKGGEGNE